MSEILTRDSCRSCEGDLVYLLSLGKQYLTAFPANGKEALRRAPLELVICSDCKLVQLRHTCPGEWLYSWYGYRSGINASMRAALQDVVDNIERRVDLKWGDIALDIGSNDGTLLRSYKSKVLRAGFEPAVNLREEGAKGIEYFVPDYFRYMPYRVPKAKVITAIAMFYDLDDPNGFLRDVAKSLRRDGLFVIQMNYLPTMLQGNVYDNISHEHVTYYSLSTLLPLLERSGFSAIHMETNDVNGGSMRVYCMLSQRPYRPVAIRKILEEEESMGLAKISTYECFSEKVIQSGKALSAFVRDRRDEGERIYVYGASTRGLVVMQHSGLDSKLIAGAAERNPEKWGRSYAHTGIVCVPEEEARQKADYFLILPWQFLEEFKVREKAFLERGGKFIVPLPELQIVESST